MSRANSAKEDMPSPREYRALKRAAKDNVKEEFQLECSFVLRLMGELGLRAGEVSHLSQGWVNFDQNTIEIPSYDECEEGQDGGPCGYCKQQARQAAKNNGISYEKALRDRWEPKNDESERNIWYGWDDGLVEIIDEYLFENEGYSASRASINRRIDRIADACKMVDREEVYPHALRGHAAMYHAKSGMRAFQLKEFMGWSKVDGAMPYIKMASDDVKTELRRIHGSRYR